MIQIDICIKKMIQIDICLENICICEYIHTLIISTIVAEFQINRPLPNFSTFSNIFTSRAQIRDIVQLCSPPYLINRDSFGGSEHLLEPS